MTTKPFSMKRISLITPILLLVLYLLLWPTSIQPVSWVVPENKGFSGAYAENNALSASKEIEPITGAGPEGVDFDAQGNLYTGLDNGDIVKVNLSDTNRKTRLGNTGGRPLGLQFDRNGNLIIADAFKGLLSVSKDGKVTTLLDSKSEVPVYLADDLDIHSDGSIWFSDASRYFTIYQIIQESLDSRPSGRLIRYDPETKEAKVILDNLGFANGVAFGPDEEFILVTETMRYRVARYWLKGPKKGTSDIFLDGLPAMPDNITYNGNGVFWLSLISPRSGLLDFMADKPWLRNVLARIPESLLPKPPLRGGVIGLNAKGEVVHNFQDKDTGRGFTSAIEHEGSIYLGSLGERSVVQFRLRE